MEGKQGKLMEKTILSSKQASRRYIHLTKCGYLAGSEIESHVRQEEEVGWMQLYWRWCGRVIIVIKWMNEEAEAEWCGGCERKPLGI